MGGRDKFLPSYHTVLSRPPKFVAPPFFHWKLHHNFEKIRIGQRRKKSEGEKIKFEQKVTFLVIFLTTYFSTWKDYCGQNCVYVKTGLQTESLSLYFIGWGQLKRLGLPAFSQNTMFVCLFSDSKPRFPSWASGGGSNSIYPPRHYYLLRKTLE